MEEAFFGQQFDVVLEADELLGRLQACAGRSSRHEMFAAIRPYTKMPRIMIVGETSSSGGPQFRIPFRTFPPFLGGHARLRVRGGGGCRSPPTTGMGGSRRGPFRPRRPARPAASRHPCRCRTCRQPTRCRVDQEMFAAAPWASELTTVSSANDFDRRLLVGAVVRGVGVGPGRDRTLRQVERLLAISRADRGQPVLRGLLVRRAHREGERVGEEVEDSVGAGRRTSCTPAVGLARLSERGLGPVAHQVVAGSAVDQDLRCGIPLETGEVRVHEPSSSP